MRLIRLQIESFGSWVEPVTIDLTGVKMLAVTGRNGAGKSTIFAVIRWMLFGEGVSIPDSEDEAAASMSFEANGVEWVVGRRRNRNGKTQAHLTRGLPGGGREQVAFGVTGVKSALGDVLRIGQTAFEASVFHRQGDPGSFAAAKPADRRSILTEIIGLSNFDPVATKARSKYRAAEANARGLSSQAESFRSKAIKMRSEADTSALVAAEATAKDRLASAKRSLDAALLEEKSREAAAAQLAAARRELERATSERERVERDARKSKAANETDLELAQKELTNSLSRFQVLQDRLEWAVASKATLDGLAKDKVKADTAVTQMENQVSAAKAKIFGLQAQIEIDQERLAKLETGASAACFTCRRPFKAGEQEILVANMRQSVSDTERRVQRGEAVVRSLMAKLSECRQMSATLDDKIAQAQRASSAIDSTQDAISDMESRIESTRERIMELNSRSRELVDSTELDQEIDALAAAFEEAKAKASTNVTASVADARRTVARFEEDMEHVRGRLARCRELAALATDLDAEADEADARSAVEMEQAEVQKLLAKAFSTSGIPQLVYGSVVQELEVYVNAILCDLTPEMTLRLVSDPGSGGLDVVAVTSSGATREYQALSGGERMRIDLALGVGLSQLVGDRSGEPLRLFAFDEGWGVLDDDGVSSALSALRRVSDRFDLVLSVTHHPDAAAGFDAHLEVERDESGSHCQMVWH